MRSLLFIGFLSFLAAPAAATIGQQIPLGVSGFVTLMGDLSHGGVSTGGAISFTAPLPIVDLLLVFSEGPCTRSSHFSVARSLSHPGAFNWYGAAGLGVASFTGALSGR